MMLKRVVPAERLVRFADGDALRVFLLCLVLDGLSCKILAILSNYYADLA
ncbi:MAG: hypothetical protein PHO89_06365 [Methylacidiphilaceae bacterium]|nr:hypothetical protein [Candidatus Methylacidiphilaceae bacterium]